MNVHLSDRFGFGKVMLGGSFYICSFLVIRGTKAHASVYAGSLCQVVCYAMMIPEGPFAVRVVAYAIAGFGIALQVRFQIPPPFLLASNVIT